MWPSDRLGQAKVLRQQKLAADDSPLKIPLPELGSTGLMYYNTEGGSRCNDQIRGDLHHDR